MHYSIARIGKNNTGKIAPSGVCFRWTTYGMGEHQKLSDGQLTNLHTVSFFGPSNRVLYKSQRNTTHMTFETALLSSGYVYDAQPGVYMKEEENGVLHTYMQIDGDVWNYEKYDADDKVLMTKVHSLILLSSQTFSLFIMTDQQMSATIYRGLFTDGEWEVIGR